MDRFNYGLKRMLQMVPVFFVVTVLVFLLVRLIPGDPAVTLAGETATVEQLELLREKLGLNESYGKQYLYFLRDLFRLDLGDSIRYHEPVIGLLLRRSMVTVLLTLVSTVFSMLISLPFGYWAGMKKDTLTDRGIQGLALLALSAPPFWIGLVLLMIFGVKWRIFPVTGWGSTWTEHLQSLVLPGLTQAVGVSAVLIRNLRNNVVDIKASEYVEFAKSKGLSAGRIRSRHIVRNALIPTATLLSLRMIAMLGGSVVIETVFTLPGVGALLVDAIYSRDYSLVQGGVLLFVIVVLLMNLLTDILYSVLDPRVKLH